MEHVGPPADPKMMNRRPRRARNVPTAALDTIFAAYNGLAMSRRPSSVSTFKNTKQAHTNTFDRRTATPIRGFKYGPRNTCAVDTFLTLFEHVITRKERRLFRQMRTTASPSTCTDEVSSSATMPATETVLAPAATLPTSAATSRAVRALERALRSLHRGKSSTAAKMKWYAHICAPCESQGHDISASSRGRNAERPSAVRANGGQNQRDQLPRKRAAALPTLFCQCRCQCANCLGGLCSKCERCKCQSPYLMGHCFGVMEQV